MKRLITSCIIIAGITIAIPALASSVSQLDKSQINGTSSGCIGFLDDSNCGYEFLGNGLTGTSTALTIWGSHATSTFLTVTFCESNVPNVSCYLNEHDTNADIVTQVEWNAIGSSFSNGSVSLPFGGSSPGSFPPQWLDSGAHNGCASGNTCPDTFTFDQTKYYSFRFVRGFSDYYGSRSSFAWQDTTHNWFSDTNINDVYFNLGNTSDFTPSVPVLSFKYPLNGQTTPLFSNFLLIPSGLDQAGGYVAKIQWYVTTQEGTSTINEASRRNNLTSGIGKDFMQKGITIPRTDFGFDLATSTDLYAFAQLYSTQDPNNPLADLAEPTLVASTVSQSILQSIPASGGDYILTSFNTNSTSTTTSTVPVGSQESPSIIVGSCGNNNASFNPTSGDFDPSCAFINALNDFIAGLGQFGNGTWNNLIGLVKKIFPLNLYFGIDDTISALNASSTIPTLGGDTISSTYVTDLNFPTSTVHSHPNIPVFPSLSNTILKYFDYKTFMDYVAYAVTGLIMLVIGLMLIRHFHKTTTEQ